MSFSNDVRDSGGKVIGFHCIECGQVKISMWGRVCNSCRAIAQRHAEIVAALQQTNK